MDDDFTLKQRVEALERAFVGYVAITAMGETPEQSRNAASVFGLQVLESAEYASPEAKALIVEYFRRAAGLSAALTARNEA